MLYAKSWTYTLPVSSSCPVTSQLSTSCCPLNFCPVTRRQRFKEQQKQNVLLSAGRSQNGLHSGVIPSILSKSHSVQVPYPSQGPHLPPKNKEKFALRKREVASSEGLLQIPDPCTVSIHVLLFRPINEGWTARLRAIKSAFAEW